VRQPPKTFLLFALIPLISGCREAAKDAVPASPVAVKGESPTDHEAQLRKARSIAVLRKEGVPFIDHLPVIETQATSKRRTNREVALRATALCFVASRAEGLDAEALKKLVVQFAIADSFTPKERKFLDNPKPSEHDRLQFVWRYECCWVMLWALGFVDDLARPEKICDPAQAVRILRDHGPEGFLKRAKLRPANEILDAADLIYRYHWAVTDARLNNRQPPGKLDPGIVLERHYALNWLIGYMGQEWDDISTDT